MMINIYGIIWNINYIINNISSIIININSMEVNVSGMIRNRVNYYYTIDILSVLNSGK